jgi:hypothetical protein
MLDLLLRFQLLSLIGYLLLLLLALFHSRFFQLLLLQTFFHCASKFEFLFRLPQIGL